MPGAQYYKGEECNVTYVTVISKKEEHQRSCPEKCPICTGHTIVKCITYVYTASLYMYMCTTSGLITLGLACWKEWWSTGLNPDTGQQKKWEHWNHSSNSTWSRSGRHSAQALQNADESFLVATQSQDYVLSLASNLISCSHAGYRLAIAGTRIPV